VSVLPVGEAARTIDWHVHTACSCDCVMPPLEACAAARAAGLRGLCFTDHVDFDPRDEGTGYYDWDRYRASVDEARRAFPDLQVLTGFELNWQRAHADDALRFLEDKPVDFVLGSVHWVPSGFITFAETYEGLSFEAFMEVWLAEALDLLGRGVCQGFAHLDYFYLQTQHSYPQVGRDELVDWVGPVLDALAQSKVSLEINTSALRKGLDEPCPPLLVLRWYRELGGEIITFGSDAHKAVDVAADFDYARELALAAGFRRLSRFEQRQVAEWVVL